MHASAFRVLALPRCCVRHPSLVPAKVVAANAGKVFWGGPRDASGAIIISCLTTKCCLECIGFSLPKYPTL